MMICGQAIDYYESVGMGAVLQNLESGWHMFIILFLAFSVLSFLSALVSGILLSYQVIFDVICAM